MSRVLILGIIWALNRGQSVFRFLLSACLTHSYSLTVVNILNSEIKLLFCSIFAGIADIFDFWIFLIHRLRSPSQRVDSLRVNFKLNIFMILFLLNHQIVIHYWLVVSLQIHHGIQRLTIDPVVNDLIGWYNLHVCLGGVGFALKHVPSDFICSKVLLILLRLVVYVWFCILHFTVLHCLFLVLVNVWWKSNCVCECHFNWSVVYHVN